MVVADGDVVAGIDAELSVGGSISGAVTDASGDPLAFVHVTLGPVFGEAVTEADGSYRINGLVAGSYTVRFADSQDRYLTEWFDDASDEASAMPVVVAQGEAVSGIDAQLAIAGSISGTVTGPDGNPVAGILVSAIGLAFRNAVTSADGSYQINGLVAGSYTVQFDDFEGRYLSEYHDDTYFEGSATLVVVGESEAVVGIDAQLSAGGSISGTLTDTDGNPVEGITVSVSGPSSRQRADDVGRLVSDHRPRPGFVHREVPGLRLIASTPPSGTTTPTMQARRRPYWWLPTKR